MCSTAELQPKPAMKFNFKVCSVATQTRSPGAKNATNCIRCQNFEQPKNGNKNLLSKRCRLSPNEGLSTEILNFKSSGPLLFLSHKCEILLTDLQSYIKLI